MKAEELMKGDWVTSEDLLNRPARYEGRYEDYTPINGKPYRRLVCLWPGDKEGASVPEDRVLPVPLTPEILEKNGFEKSECECYYGCYYNRKIDEWEIEIYIGRIETFVKINKGVFPHINNTDCHFLHKLQQIFTICGIEKEITLDGISVKEG